MNSVKSVLLSILFVTTNVFAIAPPKPGIQVNEFFARDQARFAESYASSSLAQRMQQLKSSSLRTTSLITFPVMLGQYSDANHQFSLTQLDSMLLGDNATGSLIDYYAQVSYDQLTIEATMYAWQTLPGNQAYYVGNDNGGEGEAARFCYDLAAANDATLDFSQYDNDGPDGVPNSGDDDGYVDVMVAVHSGGGAETGDDDNIWSHRWTLSGAHYYYPDMMPYSYYETNDVAANGGFIKINDYMIQPEQYGTGLPSDPIIAIGVYCHELGHVLGLPDLYDTDGTSAGIGNWGVMSGGSYGGDGAHPGTPAQMCAWSKEFMGWLDPIVVSADIFSQDIQAVEFNEEAYKIHITDDEYYLIENRQQIGFDQYLFTSGICIWHVDNTVQKNTNEFHKKVDLEEADGLTQMDDDVNRGDDGDLFPGSTVNRRFGSDTTPNSTAYSGMPSGFNLENISNSSATMTGDFIFDDPVEAGGDVVFAESFESGMLPNHWVALDEDGDGENWHVQSEPFTDEDMAYLGNRGLRCMSNSTASNDWLITSLSNLSLSGDIAFSFLARSRSDASPGDFNVLLSTTGSDPTDFTVTLASVSAASPDWTYYAYDLSSYVGQPIYLAIQMVTVNGDYLYLDDFHLITSEPVPDPSLTLSSNSLSMVLPPGETGAQDLSVSNVGELGSLLTYDVSWEYAAPAMARLRSSEVPISLGTRSTTRITEPEPALEPVMNPLDNREQFTISYHGSSAYLFHLPDQYGATEFAVRFTPETYVNILEGLRIVFNGVVGMPDATIHVYSDNGFGFPGTELGTVILSYADITPGYWQVVNLSSLNLSFEAGEDFFISYSVNGGVYGSSEIKALADAGGMGLNRSLEFDGSNWGYMQNDWGTDYEFLMEAQVYYTDEVAPTWLSVTPTAGAIQQNETDVLTVQYDATDLVAGTYHATISLNHNASASTDVIDVSFVVDQNMVITALTPSPGSVTTDEGQSIQFQVEAHDPDGHDLAYLWELGEQTVSTTTSYLFEPGFDASGDYALSLLITDSFSDRDTTFTWDITVQNVNQAPLPFALLTPLELDTVHTLTPHFLWVSAQDPDPEDIISYHLILGRPGALLDTIDVGTDTSFIAATALLDNTHYQWDVIALDPGGLSQETSSGFQNFVVNGVNDVPTDFQLIAPVANLMVTSLTPEFLWFASADPDDGPFLSIRSQGQEDLPQGNSVRFITGYELQYGLEPDLSDAVSVVVSDTNFTPETVLMENQDYYWTVSAMDDSSSMTPADTAHFWTNSVNEAPAQFLMLEPTGINPPEITTLTPTFRWNSTSDPDIHDAIIYRLSLGQSALDMVEVYAGTDTSWTLSTALQDNAFYSWQVWAEDPSGELTAGTNNNTANPADFIVNTMNDAPEPATLIYPDSAIVISNTPTFSWLASYDPDPGEMLEYEMHWWYTGGEWDSLITTETSGTVTSPLTRENLQYFWQVISMDDQDGIAQSRDGVFWLDTLAEPPGEFSLIAPADGSSGLGTRPELTWEASIDPDPFDTIQYIAYIATDSLMENQIEEIALTTESSTPDQDLQNDSRYYWQVAAMDEDSLVTLSEIWSFDVGYVAVDGINLPQEFSLDQNYPNPFNPMTTIRYGIPNSSDVNLVIYDLRGREIRRWSQMAQNSGWYNVVWDGTSQDGVLVPTGVYLARFQTEGYSHMIKMVYLR
ncbi:MAG: M6 family metalloprotease domain-containing protein [Candidatus Marinimicrobia bacterium]|nr:M6 family metalloprotease domain-containing protein [Candidatus Neomarinimicrobiota bacterium]